MSNEVTTGPTTEFQDDGASQYVLSLWERTSFRLTRAFLMCFLRLFGFRVLYLFGQCFSTLEWLINYKRRGRFKRRLKNLLGDSLTSRQRRSEVRRFFTRTRCDKMFYLILDRIPRDKALARFHYNGTELIDEALARGKGCFVAMSHHGTYHVGGMLMALRGYRIAGVRDPREGGMRRFVQQLYAERYPELESLKVLYADTYPRDIYRCFHDNYIVGAALDVHRDRGEHKHTVRVHLLGQEREFLAGTLQIALRCGAGVLQGFVISEPNFNFQLHILGPLVEGPEDGETPERLQTAMQAYAENIEQYTRRYPNHVSRA